MPHHDVCFICKKQMTVIGMPSLDSHGQSRIYVYWLCANSLIELLILIIINSVMRGWFQKVFEVWKLWPFYEVTVITWPLWSYAVVNVHEKCKPIVFYTVQKFRWFKIIFFKWQASTHFAFNYYKYLLRTVSSLRIEIGTFWKFLIVFYTTLQNIRQLSQGTNIILISEYLHSMFFACKACWKLRQL